MSGATPITSAAELLLELWAPLVLNCPRVGPVKVQAILAPHKYMVSDFEGQLCPVVFEHHELKPYYLHDPASMTTGGAKQVLQDVVQQLKARERSQTEV